MARRSASARPIAGSDLRLSKVEVVSRVAAFESTDQWETRSARKGNKMNGSRYYGVRVEGAKFGVGFGSALAITISYSENHSILWAMIDGILSWLYVVYCAFSRMTRPRSGS
jgi:hypothetical protein